MSNHENETQAERYFEDLFEWLNTSPCRFLVDIDPYDEVKVHFYPLKRHDHE